MPEQSGNRIPKVPNTSAFDRRENSSPDDANSPTNGQTGDGGLKSSDASQGGCPNWASHPNPENSFNIEAGELFKQQGNLPKVKKSK